MEFNSHMASSKVLLIFTRIRRRAFYFLFAVPLHISIPSFRRRDEKTPESLMRNCTRHFRRQHLLPACWWFATHMHACTRPRRRRAVRQCGMVRAASGPGAHRQGPRVQGRRSNNGLAAGKVASREPAKMVHAVCAFGTLESLTGALRATSRFECKSSPIALIWQNRFLQWRKI